MGVPTKKSQQFRAFARFFITWASLSNSGLTKRVICNKIGREKKKSRFFLSNLLKLLKKSWLGGVVTIHPTITGVGVVGSWRGATNGETGEKQGVGDNT